MAAEDNRFVHDAFGDCFTNLCAHVVAFDAGYNTVFDVTDNWFVNIKNRTCIDGQVFISHLCDLFQNHVQDIVAVSHVVME